MKRIYSIKETVFCIFAIIVCVIIAIVVILNLEERKWRITVCYSCIVAIIVLLVKTLMFLNCITIENNIIKVFDYPFLATNSFYVKKRSLILWNNEINVTEVESFEIVRLTRKEQKEHIGYIYMFNRFLKINMKNSYSSKYICISKYFKSQIRTIMNILEQQIVK